MTSKERMRITMRGGRADRVPAAPDLSNMVPCRLTGKPFWDVYLYRDPPIWKAFIDAVKHFGIDGFMDCHVATGFVDDAAPEPNPWQEVIVERTAERIITRRRRIEDEGEVWRPDARVYRVADSPANVDDATVLGLPETPTDWEPVEGVREWPTGLDLYRLIHAEMGEAGVVGVHCGGSLMIRNDREAVDFYDHPEVYRERSRRMLDSVDQRFERLMALDPPPDVVCCGGSGTLIFQTPAVFRELGLPIVKRVAALCREAGVPSHVHSCGPERALVEICARETDLSVIDPLERPPMGDCHLRDLRTLVGDRLCLKGNLHTTDHMLRGSKDDVLAASREAIGDAAWDGPFILSTGDQCGRDTPDENIAAMIEAVETWGRYQP